MIDNQLLKDRRNARGMSLEALAAASGISRATLHRLEKGQVRKPNSNTIDRLSRVLKLTPAQLAGKEPIEEDQKDSWWDPKRANLQIRMTNSTRNALHFVAARYQAPATEILELAPLMFHLLAGESLQARRRALAEIEEARTQYENTAKLVPHLGREATDTWRNDDLLDAEEQSINQRDVTGRSIIAASPWLHPDKGHDNERNPFVRMLRERLKTLPADEGWASHVGPWEPGWSPTYEICEDEIVDYCNGDEGLASTIINGRIGLHEIPRELRQPDRTAERMEWMRSRCAEIRQEELGQLPEMLAELFTFGGDDE